MPSQKEDVVFQYFRGVKVGVKGISDGAFTVINPNGTVLTRSEVLSVDANGLPVNELIQFAPIPEETGLYKLISGYSRNASGGYIGIGGVKPYFATEERFWFTPENYTMPDMQRFNEAEFPNDLVVKNGTGTGSYYLGEDVTITVGSIPEGMKFDKWTSVGGGSFADAGAATTTYIMPDGNASVTALFK